MIKNLKLFRTKITALIIKGKKQEKKVMELKASVSVLILSIAIKFLPEMYIPNAQINKIMNCFL